MDLKKGQRVRFVADNLGASERDELHRVVADRYGRGDESVVDFKHPNKKACPDWWYVAVDSKSGEPRKLYVGVTARMVEVLS